MEQKFSAILFDCSGVIIDSNFHQFVSWKRLFDEEGVPFSMVDFQIKVSGAPREVGIRAVMGEELIQERVAALAERKQEIFDTLIDMETPAPFPSVFDLLQTLRKRGVKLAAVSSSRNALKLLERTRLSPLFHVIVAPSQEIFHSSEEMLYREAVEKLGVAPAACIVVEDSPTSIATAKAMGMFTVGIAVITHPAALRAADVVVHGHEELKELLLRLCA